ncbi:MAG: shikimate kinase [Pelagibacteraceae bacterium]|nr:shikimate kinase [Pelagibacteraceae bacterium]|tara:strand:+ start:6956 stop:7471 length:516 start_codon:yes stop_codon:yes gene_type:complete
MEKNLILTGMMGVGKTTIGKRLAKELSYAFIDMDKIIEKQEGESISSIFRNKGEDYFRKIEKKLTIIELKKNSSVISLGGGAFLNSTIRQYSKKKSISFWLDVPIEILIKRLKKSKNRPVLEKEKTDASIKKIYFIRKKFYNKAHYRIKCKALTLKQIIEKILNFYEKSRD